MDELRKNLANVAASLQVLAANTTANTRDLEKMTQDLEKMARRSEETEKAVQELRGTFASIERHLVKLFERDAEMQAWKGQVEARLEALEKPTPPAA